MNIILGDQTLTDVADRYILLELDRFRVPDREDPITAYCVLEPLPLNEMLDLPQYQELHAKLMENYRRKNWSFCEQAIEHLRGKWNGDVDSFYQDILTRVDKYKQSDPGDTWDGTIDKTVT